MHVKLLADHGCNVEGETCELDDAVAQKLVDAKKAVRAGGTHEGGRPLALNADGALYDELNRAAADAAHDRAAAKVARLTGKPSHPSVTGREVKAER